MAEDIFNLRTKISMDTVDFNSSIQEVSREMKKLKSETKLADADMKLYGKTSDSMGEKLKVLSKLENGHTVEIKNARAEYEKYRKEYELNGNTLDNNSKKMDAAINKETQAKAALAKTRAEMGLLNTEILRNDSHLIKWGSSLTDSGNKLNSFGKSMDGVANTWLRVSGVTLAATAGLVGAAVQWESSVASMAKTIDATPEDFAALTGSIRDLALEIPMSAASLAELAATAGQLGIETPKIAEFTETVAAMGVSSNLSATEAANSFARLANITGMSQDDFDRLGSSVIELGNNFATTESEISDMALRLAGAGTTVGLTEPDILGLATALSSLGIEAESGGSSMSKLMVEMQLATAQGGDYLQQFADVAGISAEEFTTAFTTDPMGAIIKFTEGLGKIDDAGGSSIETLDNMGISEIRMRDALLRLANGSDILSTAVQTSNTAWEENTALQVEADKRYATTESQLLLLKNKLTEVAISAGEELLPSLNNIVDSLDPMIESLSDGVKWFANLDDSTKEATLKLAGFVIAGGPVLKGLAGITKALGSSVKGFGKLSLGIGETIIAGTKATTSTGALTTSLAGMTTGASASTGGLGALFAGLTTTVGGVVILTGAIAGIGAVLLKMKDDYDLSKKQTELWGDGISEETADALDSFKTFNMEANNELDNFNSGMTDSTDGVVSAYDDMIESLKGQAEDAKSAITESLDYLPEKLQEKFQESVDRRVLNIDNLIIEAETAEAKITEILRTAESERRALTEDEQARIEALQTQIANVQAELAAENAEQQKKILGNLNTDIENLNKAQLQSHYDMLTEKRKSENEDYDKSIAALNEYRDQLTDTEYLKYLDEINDAHDESNKDLVASQAAALAEMGASQEAIDLLLSESGMTYAEAMDRYAAMTENSTKGMIENTDEMSETVKEANRTWNSMIFNPITGEVNSNIAEVVNVAVESESSWNELKFALLHADMDSNTKEQIKQALIDNGKWNELTFAEQQAIMTTTAKDAAQEFMEASGKWDELSPEEKKLWMDTNSNETMIEFLQSHGQWEALSPELKDYVTDTNAELTEVEFDGAYRAWQAMNPKEVAMNTTTNAWAVAEEVRRINAGIPDENVYVDVVTRRTYVAGSPTGQQQMYATGTNFHKGGMAILGDGGRKEPYLTPDGRFGVSPSTDTLYNLPRGSKVWSSIQKFKSQAANNDYLKSFMGQLPRFAMGTPTSFLDSPKMPNVFNEQKPNAVSSNDNYNIYLTVNGELPDSTIRKMATRIEKELKNINDRKTSSIGGAVRF